MESSILSEVDDTSILRTGLSTSLSLSSQPATASRLLPPRSGLERSDFVPWHFSEVPERRDDVRSWGEFGHRACIAEWPSLTRSGLRPGWGSAPQHLDFRTIQICPRTG